MRSLVDGKEKTDKAARERSETADRVMRLLTLYFFKHLHSLLGKNMLYTLDNKNLCEWSAVQHFCFTAPMLPLAFATAKHETASSLQVERKARSRVEEAELDDEGNAERG